MANFSLFNWFVFIVVVVTLQQTDKILHKAENFLTLAENVKYSQYSQHEPKAWEAQWARKRGEEGREGGCDTAQHLCDNAVKDFLRDLNALLLRCLCPLSLLCCPTYGFGICCWYFLLVVTSVPPRICVPHMAALENFTVNIILITPSVCVQCTTNSVASQADKTSPGLGVRAESDPARTLSFKPANKGQGRQPVCLEFTTAAQAPQTSKLCFPLPLPFPLFPTLILAVSRF